MFEFSFSINADDVWRIIPEYGYVSELEGILFFILLI